MKEGVILRNIQERLGIAELNDIQKKVLNASHEKGDLILYSPTGSGKTLAFIVPILKAMNDKSTRLQTLIIAPSRELVIQIFDIVKAIATPFKVTCCYGGHSFADEKQSLSVSPGILIATPGRLLDHMQRGNIDVYDTRYLVLDEFDKSLELGFSEVMRKILRHIPNLSRRILTSATVIHEMPDYTHLFHPIEINLLENTDSPQNRIEYYRVLSPSKDKLDTLRELLLSFDSGKTIVFVNYRESVERVYNYLNDNKITCGLYHGALEQIEREKAIAMFNNGSYNILITTDLAARGLDIVDVQHVVHYHLPISEEVYTHRNGRTARVQNFGEVFVVVSKEETFPDFIDINSEYIPHPSNCPVDAQNATIFLMAGKKEKISKGDILGFLMKNYDGLAADKIGKIDVKDHFSLVAVDRKIANDIISKLSNSKIKGIRVRMSLSQVHNRLTKNKALR